MTLKDDRERIELERSGRTKTPLQQTIYDMGKRNEQLIRLLRKHNCKECADIGEPCCNACGIGKVIGPYKR